MFNIGRFMSYYLYIKVLIVVGGDKLKMSGYLWFIVQIREREREKKERKGGLSEKCVQIMDLRVRLVLMVNGYLI